MRVDPGGLFPGWGPPLLWCCGVCPGVPSAWVPPAGGAPAWVLLRRPPGGGGVCWSSSLPRAGFARPGLGLSSSHGSGPCLGRGGLARQSRGERFPFGLGLLNRSLRCLRAAAEEAWWAGRGPSPLGAPPLGLGLPNRTEPSPAGCGRGLLDPGGACRVWLGVSISPPPPRPERGARLACAWRPLRVRPRDLKVVAPDGATPRG